MRSKGTLGVKLHQYLNNTDFFGNVYFPKAGRGDVVFFPGCTFSGYSPKLVMKVYAFLLMHYENIGICTNCCNKPSKIIKSKTYEAHTEKLLKRLQGVTEIITCCPGCTALLEQITDVKITPIYTVLKEHFDADWVKPEMTYTVHDPCPFRKKPDIHANVRDVLALMNIDVEEFQRSKDRSICCGKSNMLFVRDREKSVSMAKKRATAAKSDRILCYCFSCVHSFRNVGKNAVHLLELIFGSEKVDGGSIWANRVRLRNLIRGKQEQNGL